MMRKLYVMLAILGGVLPFAFFGVFFWRAGLDLSAFVSGLFATMPASGFTVDLLFSSFVFWGVMIALYRRRRGPAPWLFIALNLLIGLSCALPAYLAGIAGQIHGADEGDVSATRG